MSGKALFVALVSLEFTPTEAGTNLLVTDQMASFVGDGMIDGARHGTEASLDNLEEFITF